MQPEQPTHTPLEVLRAASEAADGAFRQTLDRNQTIALVADAVWRLGIAEGLRQATPPEPVRQAALSLSQDIRQAIDVLYGDLAMLDDSDPVAADAAIARDMATVLDWLGGPWEPAEQPEPAPVDWTVLGGPKDGYCCPDSYASHNRPEVLHSGNCPDRCRVPVPTQRSTGVPAYPCALTIGHDGDHWLHPSYRAEQPEGSDR